MSIAIGVGILSRSAWGFVIFGLLVLFDNFLVKSPPPSTRVIEEREVIER
jgi:hypothetical protein